MLCRITDESDYAIWTGHFELHIPVMGYGLKACEGVSPQQGVISAIERCHIEEQLFGPVVFWHAKYYIKFNFLRASCFLTGDDASKGSTALLDACSINMHFVERVLVDEVKPTAAVREQFGESKTVHYGF